MSNNTSQKSLSQFLESNDETKNYFDTLPEFVRETLMQAKGDITDVEELKSCAQNICKNNCQ